MARELVVVWAGRHQRSSWEDICATYRRKIAHMSAIRDVPVRARVASEDPQRLRAEGDRLFASSDPPEPVERPALVQGALEGSNVRPILEMTRLTAELGEFQFAAQFAEREGERLQTAVERIPRRRS